MTGAVFSHHMSMPFDMAGRRRRPVQHPRPLSFGDKKTSGTIRHIRAEWREVNQMTFTIHPVGAPRFMCNRRSRLSERLVRSNATNLRDKTTARRHGIRTIILSGALARRSICARLAHITNSDVVAASSATERKRRSAHCFRLIRYFDIAAASAAGGLGCAQPHPK